MKLSLDLLIEIFTDDQHRIQGQLRDVDDNRCLFGGVRYIRAGTNDLGRFDGSLELQMILPRNRKV